MADADSTIDAAPVLGGVTTVSAVQARAVQEALADAGLSVDAVIERAAASVAGLILDQLLEELTKKPVAEAVITVMAGTGHKGAIALGVAKVLIDAGAIVNVVLARQPKEYTGPGAAGIAAVEPGAKKVFKGYNERAFDNSDLVVDGLIGAGLEGKPKASISLLVKGANFSMRPIVAIDVPTGMNPDVGTVAAQTVKARATVAVGLPKRGLTHPHAGNHAGQLYLADAGIPAALWEKAAGVKVEAPFGKTAWRALPGAAHK